MTRPRKVEYRDKAWSDLDEIFWYIAETSGMPRTAHAYVRRIEARCFQLVAAPYAGRLRDDLFSGLRTVPFERSALICYVIDGDTIWITNIFRRGRDFEAILRGDIQSAEDD
jgi:toxin ParE1/3/4